MALGLPEQQARTTLSRGLNRAAQSAAFFCLLGTMALAVVSTIDFDIDGRLVVLPAAVVMIAALLLVMFRPRLLSIMVFFAVGVATVFGFTVLALQPDSPFPEIDNPIISLPIAAMVLVGGTSAGTGIALLWTVLGFVLGEAAVVAGCLVADFPWQLSAVPAMVLVLVVVARTYDGLTRSAHPRDHARLDEASRQAREVSVHHDYEVRALARLNDIAMSHLMEIAANGSGRVDEALRSGIRRDLELIIGRDWAMDRPAAEPAPEPAPDSASGVDAGAGIGHGPTMPADDGTDAGAALPRASEAAVTAGIRVRTTGSPQVVGLLREERRFALDAAVAQCFVNVGRHAGVDDVELLVGLGGGEVTIAVIDSGAGFDLASVPSDRIGIRTSIVGRMEQVGGTARIWSTVGVGTTIVLAVPTEVPG
ncbi:sensor histidine kinase [Agromyces sp. LHK192]|uniref:sensor histidine kinase n=1 Tax=Agromyces sp. LHK192 TaxID=2498704 RepID=UPI000FD907C1|nr:hypothetical protein [Agromyces sp. LHK192]